MTKTEPKWKKGIAARSRFDNKRGRILSVKWSNKSGWWVELHYPDGTTISRPESDVMGLED